MDKTSTPAEIRAWIAASNIARFQTELDSETDVFRYNILVALLEMEFSKFANEPLPERSILSPSPQPNTRCNQYLIAELPTLPTSRATCELRNWSAQS
jgi:hypothetical protein